MILLFVLVLSCSLSVIYFSFFVVASAVHRSFLTQKMRKIVHVGRLDLVVLS